MDQLSPEALLQLAQYQPCRNGGVEREAAFEQMVPAVLMESGGSVGGPDLLRDAFQTLFGVEIEHSEIEKWLENLESQKVVERGGNVISVTPDTRDELENRREEFESLSATARSEWRSWVVAKAPEIADAQLAELEKQLDDLIALMVAYHGAEAAVILHPEEPRAEVLRETLSSQVDGLPELDPALEEVRREALAQFFAAPTEAQRRFLADRLDHGFFATVGTLRPTAAVAVREGMEGQRLYLDTNLLIPVLGLAGESVNRSATRLLELTQGLGVQLAVTSQTLEELQHSLKHARSEVTKPGLPARRYGGVMADEARRMGGISLLEGFYQAYVSHGAEPDEWFRKAAIVKPRLSTLGVDIVDEGLTAVLKDEKRIKDYVDLLGQADFQKRRGRESKSDLRQRHDVIHRCLVERLRGTSHRIFASAQYWFLTEDKLLPHFAQMTLDEEQVTIPFCISGSAWAQIARCFTPRTDDYDQTVTDLLASPYIRFGRTHGLGEIQQVVSRITMLLDDPSPELVATFVKDETIEAVAGVEDQTEKDEVALRAYRQTEDEVAERLVALRTRVEAMEAGRSAAEAVSEDAEQLRSQLEAAESARTEERSASSEEIEDLKTRKRKGDEAWEQRLAKEQALRARDRRRLALALASLASIALIVLAVMGNVAFWVPLATIGSLLAFLVSPLVERSPWAWRLGFVLGVAGTLLGVVQLTE